MSAVASASAVCFDIIAVPLEYFDHSEIKGHPANERDGIVKRNREKGEMLESVLVDFKPITGSKLHEYAANWDIVLGRTVEETEDGTLGIGLGKPDRPKFNPPSAKR